jgi:hypothetical protein
MIYRTDSELSERKGGALGRGSGRKRIRHLALNALDAHALVSRVAGHALDGG